MTATPEAHAGTPTRSPGAPLLGWALAALLLSCGLSPCARAYNKPTLRVAAPVAAQLRPGRTQSYLVRLKDRDCALGTLVAEGVVLTARVFAPGQELPLRRIAGEPARPLHFAFCSDAPGDYRLDVIARSGNGSYTLTLEAILARKKPSKPASVRLESARLRELETTLHTRIASTNAFWQEVERSGTPLVEPVDDKTDLVTFLWRGDASTRVVSLHWPAWSFGFADRSLTRLGDSDVWWKSLRLPHDTRLSYRIVVDPPTDPSPDQSWEDRVAAAVWQVDPRNPKHMPETVDKDFSDQRSILELPGALPERFLSRKPAPPAGSLQRHSLASRTLGNTHDLTVYLPAGYDPHHAAYPLLILLDGETYLDPIPTPGLLDQLIADAQIPKLIAVFVRNETATSRDQELPCNSVFAEFLATELLPFVQAHYPVTRDPTQVCLAGASFGGLASSYAAFRHPELFGLVLSQSGSYWWSFPSTSSAFDGIKQAGWLTRRFRDSERLPIRFYMSAGAFESEPGGNGVLESSRAFDALLRAKGYVVQYEQLSSGHDVLAWRASLPNGLIALFGGVRAKPP